MFSGLTNPTVVRFASDGRVFVAEKSGLIKVFDSMSDTTPTVFANLSTNVHNYWDRGLLGMALDPNFPAAPYVYVLYTYDHQLGSPSPPPRWGDTCPNPPGGNSDGCVVSGRLSRLEANGNVMMGSEQVLVEDWCSSIRSTRSGRSSSVRTARYMRAGDGASFVFVDRAGWQPLNPCGDPPGGVGAVLTPRQGVRFAPVTCELPETRSRWTARSSASIRRRVRASSNPLAGNPDANARRIIAHGLRNPFRFTFRPGTSELWLAEVGWVEWEEINRILDPADAVVENFGWPCWKLILASQATTRPTSPSARPCTATRAPTPSPTSPTTTGAKSSPARAVPRATLPSGIDFSAPQASSYPPDYQGALLRRLHARLHLGDEEERQSDPVAGKHPTFVDEPPIPSTSSSAPTATSTTSTSTAEPFARSSRPSPATAERLPERPHLDLDDQRLRSSGKDQSNGEFPEGDGGPLTLNGTTYPKGLAHMPPRTCAITWAGLQPFYLEGRRGR